MNHYDTVIIGAGVAGCCAAYFLHKAGQKVLVIDKNGIASGGSGAAGAFLSPKIGSNLPLKQLSDKAFEFSIDFYKNNFPEYFHQTGIIRIPKSEKDYMKIEKFNLPQKHNTLSTKELLNKNIKSKFGGIEFSDAGICDSKDLCEALTKGVDIKIVDVKNIKFDGEFWHIEGFISRNIIMATGYENNLIDIRYMSIEGIWGNRADFISDLELESSFHEGFSTSANIGGIIKLGASHELDVNCTQPCNGEKADELLGLASEFIDCSDFKLKELFCGMRASNRDYTPVVGSVVDVEQMLKCPNILNGRKYPLVHYKNLFVFNALGARGFVLAPYLANELSNHLVSGSDIDKTVNPNRLFWNWVRKYSSNSKIS